MIIYIVRHGQSQGNLLKLHQGLDVPLSETGVKQASLVGKRFKTIPIDIIYASDHLRAKQTAEIVSREIGKPIEYSENIREMLLAPKYWGISESDPRYKKEIKLIRDKFHEENFRADGSENFWDFKKRVYNFMKELEKCDKDNILIVTHGYVLRVMMGYVLFKEKFNSQEFVLLRDNMETVNTGITICTFNNDERWQLLTFNDHAHLGEI